MTKSEALKLVGGLGSPSKMPCYSYSIPAQKCITGMKLRNVVNSICSKCYALKGMYVFPVVKAALLRRFESLNHPLWVEAMTTAINAKSLSGYFRWHDSGDLQSLQHLKNIVQVARNLPGVQFWLPTREYATVSEYLKGDTFPDNLTVRLSALMLEAAPPVLLAARLGLTTSGVSKEGFTCPASTQGNKCGDCRACWQAYVPNVNYKTH